jgi:Tfp pilus assembly protein PilN
MMGMDQVNALKIVSGVHDHLQVALHENYALVDYKSESFDSDISRRHALDEEIQESYRTHSIVIGGNVERRPEHSVGDGSPDLSIFRLPSRYTVASGLAASFFLPELAGPNFLSSAGKLVLSESIYRRATSRMVLMLGGTFLVMLLATALLEGLMSMRLKTIDEQFEVLGTNYSEIVALEEEIGELNDHLRSDQKLHQHGRVGRILSEVSLAIPNETSLERLDFTSSDTLGGALILVGKSRSIEAVTSFMREIQKSHYMRGVRLVRSGTDASVRPGGASDSRSSTPISFEIRIEVN